MTNQTENLASGAVFVAVAPSADRPLAPRLIECLHAAGTEFDEIGLRELSSGGDLQACECEFNGAALGAVRRLGVAAPALKADFAIVPAQNRRKRLLISDMDSTIIGQECLDELADFAGLKAQVSEITERAMRGELDFEEALTTRVGMLKGLNLDALQKAYEARITLNIGAKTLVATMKAHGGHTVLVSGGFTFFTERVAKEAGFEAHRGNTLIDDGTMLTGDVGRPILGREAKLTALDAFAREAGLSREDALALGDGANDLAMIEAAGLGIAYQAKPVVAEKADAAITHTDLRAALFFQGYFEHEFAHQS